MDHQAAATAADSPQLDVFSLADSFINFDYEPDNDDSEPTHLASVFDDPPANSSIEQKIEQMSLVDNDEELEEDEIIADAIVHDDGGDAVNESSDSESESATSTSSSTTSSTPCSDSFELEEGGILDSDAAATDDDAQSEARSQNDLQTLPMVPQVNVTLGPHHRMYSIGVIKSILGAKVIVEGVENHDPLNEGSILWMTQRRRPLGIIDEIFGPVKSPYYVVRYNSDSEIPEGICRGTMISYVPEFANHVLNNEDIYKKGYDVSSVDDEHEAEFSDDEKEAEYMRIQKMIKRDIENQKVEKRGKNRKGVPPNEGSISTLPDHGHCSLNYGTGHGLVCATNVSPPFPSANASPNFTSSQVWRNETTLPHAPAMPFPGHGHFSPIYGTGQGFVGATNVNPPFPHGNVGPNFTSSGVWRNGTTLPHGPAMPLPANVQYSPIPCIGQGFVGAANVNPSFPHQFPAPGFQFQQQVNPGNRFPPFQQQLNPSHGFPPAAVYTGTPQPQFQPPMQFNPGASAGRGRWNGRGRTFHHGGHKGW